MRKSVSLITGLALCGALAAGSGAFAADAPSAPATTPAARGGAPASSTPAAPRGAMPSMAPGARGAMPGGPPPVTVSAAAKDVVAVFHGTEGNEKISGMVTIAPMGAGIHFTGEAKGLTAGRHGFHVHEFGDLRDSKGESAGGHFNPAGAEHGKPDATVKHKGDMGNIEAGADGTAKISIHIEGVRLDEIVGRSVVIHEKEDDFGQPTGNAGGRIAVGVIGYAKPAASATPEAPAGSTAAPRAGASAAAAPSGGAPSAVTTPPPGPNGIAVRTPGAGAIPSSGSTAPSGGPSPEAQPTGTPAQPASR